MDPDTLIIVLIGLALTLGLTLPYLRRQRHMERDAVDAEHTSIAYGLDEPLSLHPVVDPGACIGTGNCLKVCPEKDVLGLRFGQAVPVSPARCIGHGLCERACPMDAIQLVFGSERRGVDIPRIRENFETNVPGLYIVGELGGMGLIRNAFEQGRQCVESIAPDAGHGGSWPLDVLIVGCGPAGLSASLNCLEHGLRFATVEKEDVGGAVRTYPRKKLVMTYPLIVPGYGRLPVREILKEELIDLWDGIVQETGLKVTPGETVTSVRRLDGGGFETETNAAVYRSGRVVLAIGRRGVPRKLGVPGEDLPKVSYALREPGAFRGDRILVVGGGDSAVEAALSLSEEPGTTVHVSYRRGAFSRIKPGNLERMEAAVESGRIEVSWSTEVVRIAEREVVLRFGGGSERAIPNDAVFVFAGGVLPTRFLEECGVQIDTKFGEPA
jgi:thioredoxin reductase/Pyruvate/2-oxoacid:ferredoxin oxidoreductase delta subunit